MPTIRSHSCSDGRCEVQHSLYRTTLAKSNPAIPEIAKESVSNGVSWFSRQKQQSRTGLPWLQIHLRRSLKNSCGTVRNRAESRSLLKDKKWAQRKAWSKRSWPRQLSATACSAWSTEKKSNGDGQVQRCTHSPLLKGECGSSTDNRKEVQKTNTFHSFLLIKLVLTEGLSKRMSEAIWVRKHLVNRRFAVSVREHRCWNEEWIGMGVASGRRNSHKSRDCASNHSRSINS
jgi:hypothetical protein